MERYVGTRQFSARRVLARAAWGLTLAVMATGLLHAQQYALPGSNNYPPGGTMMPGQMGLGQMAQQPMAQNGPIHQPPMQMASPLAGGPAAAQGDQFTDVYGNPIIMQTSYCPSGPEGCYGGGYGGGLGDPMAVDFGGYTEDQIGPHYFDVSFGAVFLQADAPFGKVGPFSSDGIGITQPKFLDPSGDGEDYEPGWEIAVRYDIGALTVLEATYMGLYDFGFNRSVTSAQVSNGGDNQLFSVFSDFGLGQTNPALDFASVHSIDYASDLQSTELSIRRYWVGNSPRISGTYLIGARYLRMTEEFTFFGSSSLDGSATVNFDSENDLVGFQFGGDGWMGLRQGFRVGLDGKAGIYNNRFKFNTNQTAVAQAPGALNTDGNQVAFVADGSANFVIDILPSWSLKGGYQVLYINSLVTVGDNINTNAINSLATPPALNDEGHMFYHGFHAGMEYVW